MLTCTCGSSSRIFLSRAFIRLYSTSKPPSPSHPTPSPSQNALSPVQPPNAVVRIEPSAPPPQMNMFRAVFTPLEAPNHPSRHLLQRRYRLRWDWHLRNFLMALIPPGVVLVIGLVGEWHFADELNAFRSARDEKDKSWEDGGGKVVKNTKGNDDEVAEKALVVDKELKKLKEELAELKEIVEAAKASPVTEVQLPVVQSTATVSNVKSGSNAHEISTPGAAQNAPPVASSSANVLSSASRSPVAPTSAPNDKALHANEKASTP